MKEAAVLNSIISYLRYSGHKAERIFTGTRLYQGKYGTNAIHGATKGTADVIACIGGRYVEIEVKKDQKTCEAWHRSKCDTLNIKKHHQRSCNQKYNKSLVEKSGGIYILTYSISDLKEQLEKLIHDKSYNS